MQLPARTRPQHMGAWGAVAAAAAQAYSQRQKSKQGSSSSGSSPSAASNPSTGGGGLGPVTTVSPTFQQSFTPQFSPSIITQTDSPGAVATPTTTMVAEASQRAAGGGTAITQPTGFPPAMPTTAPLRSPSFQMPVRDRVYSDVFTDETPFDVNRYLPTRLPRADTPAMPKKDWVPALLIAGGIGIAALAFFGSKRTPGAR